MRHASVSSDNVLFCSQISCCRAEAPEKNDDDNDASSSSSDSADSVAGSEDGGKKKKTAAAGNDDDEDPVLECAMPGCDAISTVAIATCLIAFCFGCAH